MRREAALAEAADLLDRAESPREGDRQRLGSLMICHPSVRALVESEVAVRAMLAKTPPPVGRPAGGCPDGAALEGFVDGSLEDAGSLDVLSHLVRCAQCRWIVASLRDEAGQLRLPQWVSEELRTADRAAAATAAARMGPWRGRRWAVATIAVGALAATFALGVFVLNQQTGREAAVVAGAEQSLGPADIGQPVPESEAPPPEATPSPGETEAPAPAVSAPARTRAHALRPGRRPAGHERHGPPARHTRELPPSRPVLAVSERLGPERSSGVPLIPPADPSLMRELPPAAGLVLGAQPEPAPAPSEGQEG